MLRPVLNSYKLRPTGYPSMELRAPSYRLSFNGNPLLGFNCLGFLLRNIQLQDTILEFTMNVIFGNAVTDPVV